MNAAHILEKLNDRLARLSVKNIWEPDSGRTLAAGQVWTVAAGCGGQPGWCWLLVETINATMANFVPLCPHAEMAGPDDLFVYLDATGVPGIAMLGLEATLARNALGECLGRLPQKIFFGILDARRTLDDPVARDAYNWGLPFFGVKNPSSEFHQAVAARMEELQQQVCREVFSSAVELSFPANLPWSAFRWQFAEFPVRLAADSGELCSPCLLAPWDDGEDHLAEAAEPTKTWAVCTHFDELASGGTEEICCEWLVKGAAGRPLGALVYVDEQEAPVGNAQAVAQDGGIYIALTENALGASAPTVDDPAKLRLVVLLEKA